ncbi:MAG: RNA polymerase sigma factor [Gammaproteobacteria bacterium]|nr:RNA polymerase sigma factor [Gammaproteobacteria bacterium]MDH5651032.1 RNA polymerase sigma factor [Gammaproteobacteria bacterium]
MGFFWQNKQFEQTLNLHWQRLYRQAYAWCHDPQLAGDLVQETLSRSCRRPYQFENDKALGVWLYKVMNNCWRDHHRQQREMVPLDEMHMVTESGPDLSLAQQQLQHTVQQAMAQLKADHRQIITLIDMEEFSYTEVAEILDIPTGTVMSRLSRGRQQLKLILEKTSPSLAAGGTTIRSIKP